MRGLLSPLIKLIVFLLVTVLATYVLAATIATPARRAPRPTTARFTDVTGLLPGDDVRVAGVQVGKIEGIKVVPRHRNPPTVPFVAQVTFSVPRPAAVDLVAGQATATWSVSATSTSRRARPGSAGPTLCPAYPGQPRPATRSTSTLFAGFKPLFEGLDATSINNLSMQRSSTSSRARAARSTPLFQQTAQLTNAIADKDAVIGNLINNLDSLLTTVGTRDTELNGLIVELKTGWAAWPTTGSPSATPSPASTTSRPPRASCRTSGRR